MRKTALVLLAVLGVSLLAAAQEPAGFKGTRIVVLSQNARVGTEILSAGEYKVTHTMENSEHIMVFKKDKQEFRVKCTLEPTKAKADQTQYWYQADASGQRVLQAIEFRGDTFRHVFTQ